jgi:ABC-type branched-subunit amino acid transport system substrate-binding protein
MASTTVRVTRHAPDWRNVAVVAVAMLLAAGCSSSGGSSGGKSSDKAPFTVAYIGEFTGAGASQNIPELDGLKAWEKARNADGGYKGHPVKVLSCDSTTTVPGAVACASQVEDAGVVIVGGVTGEVVAAAKRLESQNKVVFTNNPTLNPKPGSNLFQVPPNSSAGIALALKTAKANGIDTMGVITTDNTTGVSLGKTLDVEAPKAGVTVSTELMSLTATDATVQLSKLKAKNVGSLYIGMLGAPAIAAMNAVATLGFDGPIFVLAANVQPHFLVSIKQSLPSAIYGVPPDVYQTPNLLTGTAKTGIDQLKADYAKASGQQWNDDKLSLVTPFIAEVAMELMDQLGAKPALKDGAKYLTTKKIDTAMGSISFPDPHEQDGALPAKMAMATADNPTWVACVTTAHLKC